MGKKTKLVVFLALILYSALGNKLKNITLRKKPCNEQEKVLITQFMLQSFLNQFLLLVAISKLL